MAGGTQRTITGWKHRNNHQHDKREDEEGARTGMGTREMKVEVKS